jgi:hypothetical protein
MYKSGRPHYFGLPQSAQTPHCGARRVPVHVQFHAAVITSVGSKIAKGKTRKDPIIWEWTLWTRKPAHYQSEQLSVESEANLTRNRFDGPNKPICLYNLTTFL